MHTFSDMFLQIKQTVTSAWESIEIVQTLNYSQTCQFQLFPRDLCKKKSENNHPVSKEEFP